MTSGGQLRTWGHRADILSKARDALLCMNDFARRWKAGEFTDYQHEHLAICGLSAKVSGESPSVNNDLRKRKVVRKMFEFRLVYRGIVVTPVRCLCASLCYAHCSININRLYQCHWKLELPRWNISSSIY